MCKRIVIYAFAEVNEYTVHRTINTECTKKKKRSIHVSACTTNKFRLMSNGDLCVRASQYVNKPMAKGHTIFDIFVVQSVYDNRMVSKSV